MADISAQTVEQVRRTGLCMGCGTCEAVCPTGAIVVRFYRERGVLWPDIDLAKCTECGLCLEVCPGHAVPFGDIENRFLDGKEDLPQLGRFSSCFLGHAAASTIRFRGASGGVATALLGYALEHGVVDAALVLRMDENYPLRTTPFIARTAAEIADACGSKYCPAAVNRALREALSSPTIERLAVVGLPCHIHGVRKLEVCLPQIAKKIVLHLGLFCVNNNTALGTEYFLRCHGIAPADVVSIRYRDEGWPGYISVRLRTGNRKLFPRAASEKVWWRKALLASAFHFDFQIPRCLLCPDQTAEWADVSLGDPWLPEIKATEKEGESFIIVRTEPGRKLVESAAQDGAVSIEPFPIHLATRAQNYRHKANVGSRIELRRRLGYRVPNYGTRRPVPSLRGLLGALRYLPSYVSHHRVLWPAIRCFALAHYVQCIAVARLKGVARRLLRRRPQRRGPITGAVAPGGGTKILLLGARLVRNLGGPSLLLATRKVLDAVFDDAEYTFLSPTSEDVPHSRSFGMPIHAAPSTKKLLQAAVLYRLFRVRGGTPAVLTALESYIWSDVVIDIWGIGFSDALGRDTFRLRATQGFRLFVAKVLGKKVVKYTADLGPFERRWNRLFSRLYLNHTVDLIFARSEATRRRLEELGVRTPIHVLPDTAFLLEPETSDVSDQVAMWKDNRLLVGLSVSHMAARQSMVSEWYERAMSRIADGIRDATGARILLIPNEVSADEAEDDVVVAQRVLQGMMHQEDGFVVPVDVCTAPQLKGVINLCDVVVAARYHTIVASLSQGIPVLAVGWHAKYEGVMGLFDLAEYVFPVDKLEVEDLLAVFQRFWNSREDIAATIVQKLPQVQGAVLKGGDLVKGLLLRRT